MVTGLDSTGVLVAGVLEGVVSTPWLDDEVGLDSTGVLVAGVLSAGEDTGVVVAADDAGVVGALVGLV